MQYPNRLGARATAGVADRRQPLQAIGAVLLWSRSRSPGWPAWIMSALGRLSSRMRGEWEVRRIRVRLHALDDRTLEDIGISRDDIRRLVGRRHRAAAKSGFSGPDRKAR